MNWNQGLEHIMTSYIFSLLSDVSFISTISLSLLLSLSFSVYAYVCLFSADQLFLISSTQSGELASVPTSHTKWSVFLSLSLFSWRWLQNHWKVFFSSFCIRWQVLHYVLVQGSSLYNHVDQQEGQFLERGMGRSNNRCPLSLYGGWQNVLHDTARTHLSHYAKNISILYGT